MSALCVIDQVPATVGNLCTGCVTKLHTTVLQVPRLLVELDVTITKQARQTTPGAGGSGGERGLVLNLAASDAADKVRMWLRAVAHLTVANGEPVPVGMRDLAAWTARRLSAAARHPEIADYHSGLLGAVAEGGRCIDRAPERRVLGTCDCGGILSTTQDRDEVWCPDCKVPWEVADLLEMRAQMLDDKVVTAEGLSVIFRSVLHVSLTAATVRKWVERKQIGTVSEKPSTFRVSDAIATWESLHGPLPGRKKHEVSESV